MIVSQTEMFHTKFKLQLIFHKTGFLEIMHQSCAVADIINDFFKRSIETL